MSPEPIVEVENNYHRLSSDLHRYALTCELMPAYTYMHTHTHLIFFKTYRVVTAFVLSLHFLVFTKQGLTLWPRLTLNFPSSSCLGFLNICITVISDHSSLYFSSCVELAFSIKISN